jgi:hypothetical protein
MDARLPHMGEIESQGNDLVEAAGGAAGAVAS